MYKELNKWMQQKCREAKKEWDIQGNCIRPKQMHNGVKSGKGNVNNMNGCIQIWGWDQRSLCMIECLEKNRNRWTRKQQYEYNMKCLHICWTSAEFIFCESEKYGGVNKWRQKLQQPQICRWYSPSGEQPKGSTRASQSRQEVLWRQRTWYEC